MHRHGHERLGNFLDHPLIPPSRQQMPTRINDALDYCMRLWLEAPMYRAVVGRTVGHFVQDLHFRGEIGSHKEREQFSQFFDEELEGFMALRLAGHEMFCYGTAFMRCHFPFARLLIVREPMFRLVSINEFPEELVEFDLQRMIYRVPDPNQHAPYDQRRKVELTFRDQPVKDFSKISFLPLNPRFCRLRYSGMSGEHQVEYLFEPEEKARVKKNHLFAVNRMPKDMLQAIRDNAGYLFDQEHVAMLKEPTISGISNEGWGMPPLLAHFPDIHRIAVLDRIDDVVSREFMVPKRVITPDLSNVAPGEGMVIAGQFKSAINDMWRGQSKDPSQINSFPFPIVMQNLGGEGRSLTTTDQREVAVGNLFRSMGIPVELFDGSLNMMQVPTAVRLFETTHMPVRHGLAKMARWMVRKVSSHMFGEAYDGTLKRPSIADDLERRGIYFNLYSANAIPGRVAFEGLGLENPVDLKVEAHKEQLETERRLAVLHREEEIKNQMGSIDDVLNNADAEQGGGPGGGGGGPGQSPVDVLQEAEQLAGEWLSIPHDGERAKAMRQVQETDQQLYAMAKDIMEKIRAQGASQGRQQAAQEYQQ